MCKVKVPKAPNFQGEKAPDMDNTPEAYRQARRRANNNGTLLTGPSGVERSAMNLGGTSLLGG